MGRDENEQNGKRKKQDSDDNKNRSDNISEKKKKRKSPSSEKNKGRNSNNKISSNNKDISKNVMMTMMKKSSPSSRKNRGGGANAASASVRLQPEVTMVDATATPSRAFGSISNKAGTPWCGGRPTIWWVGHEHPEAPWCYNKNTKKWKQDGPAVMDYIDPRNSAIRNKIDRHDCVALDVNQDGVDDIMCLVGAQRGQGIGYNELVRAISSD